MSGMTGRPPAAITNRSAVISAEPPPFSSTVIALCPVNRPVPDNTVMFGHFGPSRNAWLLGRVLVDPAEDPIPHRRPVDRSTRAWTPSSPARRAASATSAG